MIIAGDIYDYTSNEVEYILQKLNKEFLYCDTERTYEFLTANNIKCDYLYLINSKYYNNLSEVISQTIIIPQKHLYNKHDRDLLRNYKIIYIKKELSEDDLE